MAATVEARRLTEAHRQTQARLASTIVRQLTAVFPLLDPTDIDATVERWLSAAIPIVKVGRTTSARLAASYVTTFRALELGIDADAFLPALADALPDEQIATSLIVTGPAALKAGTARARPLRSLLDTARTATASAGMRHALNGGRDTVIGSTNNDARALGWARSTGGGKVCAFCAMLAGRGPVYGEDTVGFQAHDHCTCTAEPVYRHDAAWPAGSERYAELWQEAALADGDSLQNFRQLIEAA